MLILQDNDLHYPIEESNCKRQNRKFQGQIYPNLSDKARVIGSWHNVGSKEIFLCNEGLVVVFYVNLALFSPWIKENVHAMGEKTGEIKSFLLEWRTYFGSSSSIPKGYFLVW